MFKKLSFVIIIAILLSACGAAAPMENDAPAETAAPESYTTAPAAEDVSRVETTAGSPELPEPVSEAEYFYFTKYSNTLSDESGVEVLIENRCVPSFISTDPERSSWVTEILDAIGRDYQTDSTNLYDYAREFVQEYGTEYFYSYSNYQQMGVARHDETVVSLIALSSLYSGGSHPNSVQVAYNLDIANQRILRLEDIIEEASAGTLAEMVRAGVDEKFAMIDGGNGLFEDYGDTIANSMVYGNMTAYWYLNDIGLVIFYNQYELGPYAAGIIKVELPYEDLKGILLEEFYPTRHSGGFGTLTVAGEGSNRIPITLGTEADTMLVGATGTVYQVQISEVLWLNDTPISQDLLFSARSLSEADVLEISGGYTDETRSFAIEFIDGSGVPHICYIHDGELRDMP